MWLKHLNVNINKNKVDQVSLYITDECINCDVCEPVCPNEAIYFGELIYEIDPNLCTECVGHFDQPQCQLFCPVDCIPHDPDHQESQNELLEKYQQLTAQKNTSNSE